MTKVTKAQQVGFFLCEKCSSVHIGMWRNGEMFAEAIPDDIIAVAMALNETIIASAARKSLGTNTEH